MIFTKVDALVKDIDVDKYHIETVILSSDDLNKKIIRVKSDHGNEFGIRLDKGQKLQNGSAFFIDDHHVLAIGVESQDLIVISPKDMDEMGITAHILCPLIQEFINSITHKWHDNSHTKCIRTKGQNPTITK